MAGRLATEAYPIVNPSSDVAAEGNFYDQRYEHLIAAGELPRSAAEVVAISYLDGKPAIRGKRKVSKTERDSAFWLSRYVNRLPSETWRSEAFVLALARYFGQERHANIELLERIAEEAADAVVRAVRYSGLVRVQHSPRRTELDKLATISPAISELCRVLDIFDRAERERTAAVARWSGMLAELTAFEFLAYASLYAFEHLVPRRFDLPTRPEGEMVSEQHAWEAINDILAAKLGAPSCGSVKLTEMQIGESLARHLSPFIFPSPSGHPARHDLRGAFENLVNAQIELNSFVSQSADAFSYDDSVQFVRHGQRLELVEVDADAKRAWRRDNRKLERLHEYWLYRALDAFVSYGRAAEQIGRPENHEANRLTYLRALGAHLRLTEIYGVGETVTADSGERTDLFQALLSLELMSAFFQQDFLEVFALHLGEVGHWAAALGKLAIGGLLEGSQNRFPLTWSARDAKIASIVGWTVNAASPSGNARNAAAILDFWTSDWVAISARLQRQEPGLHPELFERPVLRLGQTLVQLPWLVGLQNNSTAAINNLRRLGARRNEAREETRRIEERLGLLFESREFKVRCNWDPPGEFGSDAGEVDLICARDGLVFVLEVKSTYLRKLPRDAWLHRTTTLRKAGQQLGRKVAAVRLALASDIDLVSTLGLGGAAALPTIHGWIVDTSIECDHENFSGFLKISLEEVLIALRDDRDYLRDPGGIHSGEPMGSLADEETDRAQESTLYPRGFSAARFSQVIQDSEVWHDSI